MARLLQCGHRSISASAAASEGAAEKILALEAFRIMQGQESAS